MNIELLSSIIEDMFLVDLYIPSSSYFKTDFRKASYTMWATEELIIWVSSAIGPDGNAPIEVYIDETKQFLKMVTEYSKKNKLTKQAFSIAKDITSDILDVLIAMK